MSLAPKEHNPAEFNKSTIEFLADVSKYLLQNKRSDAQSLFKEMDKDRNGNVDLQEFLAFFMRLKKVKDSKGDAEG